MKSTTSLHRYQSGPSQTPFINISLSHVHQRVRTSPEMDHILGFPASAPVILHAVYCELPPLLRAAVCLNVCESLNCLAASLM